MMRTGQFTQRTRLSERSSEFRVDVGNPQLGIISELPVNCLSARFWEKHREIIRQMFAPVTQALVEDGLIGSRHVVLEILLRVPESQH